MSSAPKPLKTHLLRALKNRTEAVARHHAEVARRAAIAAAAAESASAAAQVAKVQGQANSPMQPKGTTR